MEKSKFLTIIIIFLLVLNLGTLTFLFMNRHGGPPPGMHPKGPNPGEFIVKELEFDDVQKSKFEELKQEHQQQMRNLRDSMHKEREQLPEIIVSRNELKADTVTSRIGNYQKQVELLTFRHFVKVYDLCNDNQKQEFGEIISEILRMMGPPDQGPPPHHKH